MRSDVKITILVGLVFAVGTIWFVRRQRAADTAKGISGIPDYEAALTAQPTLPRPTPTGWPGSVATATPRVSAPPTRYARPTSVARRTPSARWTLTPSTRPVGPTTQPKVRRTPGPIPTATPERAIIHQVKKGETLSSIAAQYYGHAKYHPRIAKANPKVDPDRLRPGTTLTIEPASWFEGSGRRPSRRPTPTPTPTPRRRRDAPGTYVVRSGDSLTRIAEKIYGTTKRADDIYNANRHIIGPDRNRLKVGTRLNVPE